MEILVAVAVLMLLVVLVAQMVSSASSLTAAGHKRMDADDEGRMVMDRIAADLAGMPRHPDLNILLVNNAGNDELYFLSRAPGYFTNSTNSGLVLVGYRVGTNGFQRVAKGLGWDGLAFTNPVTNGLNDPDDYHVIAPSVFRMEYALMMKPGSTNVISGTTNTNSMVSPTFLKTNSVGQALKDVAGIHVVVGVLDQTSRKIVSQGGLSGLAGNVSQFADFSASSAATSGVAYGQWISNAPSALTPRAAASQIRLYQRYHPLN